MSKAIQISLLILFSMQFLACNSDNITDKSGDELEVKYSKLLNELKQQDKISAEASDSTFHKLDKDISKLNQIGRRLRSIDNEKYGNTVLEGEYYVVELRKEVRQATSIKVASEAINTQYDLIKNRSEELETAGLDTSALSEDEKIEKKELISKILILANEFDTLTEESNPCEEFVCPETMVDKLNEQKLFVDSKRELSIVLNNKLNSETSSL